MSDTNGTYRVEVNPDNPFDRTEGVRNWCPVCEHGTAGYCDERCETRTPNGQPGHFPGQISTVLRNAPTVDDAVILASTIRMWREIDREWTEQLQPESLALHPAGTCDGCGNEAVELCTWLEDDGASGQRLSYCRPCMGDDADDPSNEWITGDPIV